MVKSERGFSMVELLTALFIMGVLAAFTLPYAITAVKDYKLHTDAMALSSYLNVVRMRAASQYAPYRLVLQDSAFGGTGTYGMEKLCGVTPAIVDASCTGNPYLPFTVRQFEVGEQGSSMGTQYLQQGNTISYCRPSGITGFPLSTVTADATGCPSMTWPMYLYFNTRGLPVDNSGNPLSNAGGCTPTSTCQIVYIQSPSKSLTDAVTVSGGGRVASWNWSSVSSKWSMR